MYQYGRHIEDKYRKQTNEAWLCKALYNKEIRMKPYYGHKKIIWRTHYIKIRR